MNDKGDEQEKPHTQHQREGKQPFEHKGQNALKAL
jgi:hypothetical protein